MVVALILAVAVGATGSSKAFAAGSARETLHGHQGIVPPGATLLGPAPSTTTLPLEVTLQPRDPSALAAEVQAVSNPRSPEYRHFLTPQQFAQRFGPTQATIAQVASALRSEGLTVGTPSSGALSLPVSGTVAQIQSAFSTPISRYRLASGKTGYDNRSAPEVPVTVAPQIEGVLGLDTLSPPQPTTTVPPASSSTSHPAATPAASPALAPGQPTPTGTSCTSSISGVESNYGALDADQLAQAYSFDPLYTANHYGAGSTVALVEMYGAGYRPSDISTFAACYGITNGGGQVTEKNLPNGGALGGNTVEAELDIETVLSLAPKANIEVYEGGPSDDLYDVFKQIVDDDTAKIISASWTNGCEAYVGQAYQNSENSLFQQAAAQGQSIFVATGDEGSEGCNTNGERTAATGTDPVTQAVDPSTGTLYIADKSSNTVTVDSEGSASNPTDFASASGPVPTGSGPDAVALDTADGKVFVANSGGSLTVIPTATCNAATNTDCSTPTPIAGNGHLSAPDALAVNGSTLYVGNSNGTVAVYDAASNTWVATVNLLASSVATALAVDATNGTMYIADASNNRVEYINIANCNATISTGCSVSPSTVTGTLGNDPVTMAVTAGDLYVGNAGAGGGISVVSLTTHGVVKTISTDESLVDNGIGLVQSVGLSPDGTKVLAIVTGLDFPGDVMATINPSTQAITATVALQDGTDSMGQLVSDGTRDYVWALDETNPGDIIQNLNLAATDPASQPYVTAVGGTSVTAVGPAPTETVWNDQLHFSEGAGGGGISQTFSMPAYQQSLGTVSGSSGTPCGVSSGDCREIPDVSADADPSTGYVIYDSYNFTAQTSWTAMGGTSGAAPLWAAVLAVDASADGNTAGYGALNPALYLLAQRSAGTYLNDITSGNNDNNATDGGSYPAMTGYDMATGLGTPIASQLAIGLSAIPLNVVVSGSQSYGSSAPTFTGTANYAGSGSAPYGVTLRTSGLSCSEVDGSTPIGPTLSAGSHTIGASTCGGATLSGADATDYTIVYTSAANDFTVNPAPLTITASSPTSTYGSAPAVTPIYSGFKNADNATSLSVPPTCVTTATSSSPPSPPTYQSSCSGAADSNYTISYVSGVVTVDPAPLTITASSPTMIYGAAVPTITPIYSGFKNGDNASSLSVPPICVTTATSSSPPSPPTYQSSCSGAADSNYTISYAPGLVTVNPITVAVAVSGGQTYGSTTPSFSGTDNPPSGITVNTAGLTCSEVDSSTPIGPALLAGSRTVVASSCSGATLSGTGASDYIAAYTSAAGDFTVNPAPLTITASSSTSTYGSTPIVSPLYSGFENGDNASSLSASPTCATTATPSSTPSPPTYPSSCSGAADSNYIISYVPGAVTVIPAPLTITASTASMLYGGTPPLIIPNYSGFMNGDTPLSMSAQPTCSTTATSSSTPSPPTYPSSCSGASDANYAITYATGAVTVNPAPVSVAVSGSQTYGSTTPSFSGTDNPPSGISVDASQLSCSEVDGSSPLGPGLPAGNHILATFGCNGAALSGTGAADYTIVYTSAANDFTVNPAPLTITASSPTSTYGSTPTITPLYSGFENGDDASSLSAQPTCNTTAIGSSTPSPPTYLSSCLGAEDSNYTISYVSGAVTVTDAPVDVAVSGSQTYGSATPSFSGTDSPPSGISVDTTGLSCSEVDPSTTIGPTLLVGSDTLVDSSCGGASIVGTDAAYYTIVLTSATNDFTVNPAPVPVAVSGDQTYGSTTPSFSGTDSPPTGVTVHTSALSCSEVDSSTPVGPGLSAGSHVIVASSCGGATLSGTGASDYAATYVPGNFTVSRVPLTITASSPTMNQGGTVPAITPTYSGFKNGDTASSLSVQPSCSTTATSSSPPSPPTYPTSCSGASDPNYTISYVPGAVTVNDPPPPLPPAPPAPPSHGYWLVGSDGGIFTFGSANFYGSTGSLKLQRPVVGITPTADRGGYWLVASDGGTFAFGDAGFYGSIPGLGLNPAGSGLPHSLNAPIVGMVPASNGQGYFVVASDGGVFAFGPGASFAGSCPGIGGCSGPAVSVIPDASGHGYWLFTATGNVYTFGDASYLGAPGNVGSPVTSAVRTPDGRGYWVLVANGTVYGYGDAANDGSPGGQLGGVNPATAVFTTSDGGGYWVVSANGAVDPYGDAPNDGGMAGTKLNGAIIAGTGF